MKIFTFLFILVAFLIQFSFLPMLGWEIMIPNLILISAVAVAIKKTFQDSLIWLFLAGFLFEIFSVSFWDFYLIIFLLTGSLAWILKNVVLDKRKNILIEIAFWFLIKLTWDILFKIGLILKEFFNKDEVATRLFVFSGNYFQETIVFVLSGLVATIIWNFIQNFLNEKN
jgi:hypothetical protein